MTLVLSVHNRDTLWLVTDRRLSYGTRKPPIEDAIKVTQLETTDGRGLLAYAGLGATVKGTHPSEWMSATLRGRHGLTFEQALGDLSDAASRELPTHLMSLPSEYRAHFIVVPSFLRGVGFRLYSIDNLIDPITGDAWYRYTRHAGPAEREYRIPRMALTGTGGIYLSERVKEWQRPLLRLLKAHDRGKVSDLLIADQLARLNYKAHQALKDRTVGPKCLVVWLRRPDTRKSVSGGAHQFYTGTDRDNDSAWIPAIANGIDVRSIGKVVMKHFLAQTAAYFDDDAPFEFDTAELDRLVSGLPSDPDEKLR